MIGHLLPRLSFTHGNADKLQSTGYKVERVEGEERFGILTTRGFSSRQSAKAFMEDVLNAPVRLDCSAGTD